MLRHHLVGRNQNAFEALGGALGLTPSKQTAHRNTNDETSEILCPQHGMKLSKG